MVLCLQDTTELDVNGQRARGLGPLSYEAQRGMYLHPTYAVTPAREPKDAAGEHGGPEESLRWTEGYARLAELALQLPGSRLVYVADREADMLSLMTQAQELGTPLDWLVRAAHNRCLADGDKLWARHGVMARSVRQQLWTQRVELPAGKGKTVSATCIVAREYDAPHDVSRSNGGC